MVIGKRATAKVHEDFKSWIEEHMNIPHDLTMRISTGIMVQRLKGISVIEVKDKKGKPKKLQFKRFKDAQELFDEIRF